MQAGKLRNLIVIQASTPTRTASGSSEDVWAQHAEVWASIHPVTGTESVSSNQLVSTTSHKITIRYLATVLTKMRVKYGTRYFDIESVQHPLEKGDKTILLCKELI